MKNLRVYGDKPFRVAVVHGGPGAPGEMAPVARVLAAARGVLEPLQTAASLDGQVQELKTILKENADLPATLIGWSWGAMLSFIFAARYPSFVQKLILIGSGPYEEKYTASIMQTRLNRLSAKERTKVIRLTEMLNNPAMEDKDTLMAQLGKLFSKADSYEPLPHKNEMLACQYHIYQTIWQQASELRKSGQLLELSRNIKCSVVAIHGEYDSHPAEGVKEPLARGLKDFRFILLEDCGHQPWLEKRAREKFYQVLNNKIPC
jgi:pimeloyl-ACP methyl ester carboxylesterase